MCVCVCVDGFDGENATAKSAWSHGVVVITLDFESSNPSSSLGGTCDRYFSST